MKTRVPKPKSVTDCPACPAAYHSLTGHDTRPSNRYILESPARRRCPGSLMANIQQPVSFVNNHALISVTAALVAGGLMAGLSPLYIGALIDSFGFAENEAGLVMSIELISLAITLAL